MGHLPTFAASAAPTDTGGGLGVVVWITVQM